MSGERNKGFGYSAALHLLIMLFAVFGLPSFLQPEAPPPPAVIAVDILPMSPITNVKPSDLPLSKKEQEKPKQAEKKPPKPPTKSEPPPEPKPEPKPEKKEEVKKAEPKPEKKPEPKKEKPKKAEEKDLDAVLKSLRENQKQEEQQEDTKKEKSKEEAGTKVKSDRQNYDPEVPLSISEVDAIRSQIERCWSVPAGAKDAHELKINLYLELAEDGTVLNVELADDIKSRYNSDSFFRAAADSAIRAVQKCSPLKNLPADKYQTWRDIYMTFDPKEILY